MNCSEHENENTAHCPSCLAKYWEMMYNRMKEESKAKDEVIEYFRTKKD